MASNTVSPLGCHDPLIVRIETRLGRSRSCPSRACESSSRSTSPSAELDVEPESDEAFGQRLVVADAACRRTAPTHASARGRRPSWTDSRVATTRCSCALRSPVLNSPLVRLDRQVVLGSRCRLRVVHDRCRLRRTAGHGERAPPNTPNPFIRHSVPLLLVAFATKAVPADPGAELVDSQRADWVADSGVIVAGLNRGRRGEK